MKTLQDYFEVKPFKEQNKYEQYAYKLHRISFPICILGSFILAYGLGAFSVVFFNWILEHYETYFYSGLIVTMLAFSIVMSVNVIKTLKYTAKKL
jgi:hypothetical protein